jgi:hypothetical protein
VKTPLSHAIRRGKWKLLRVGAERMLFDLSADAGETKNLIATHRGVAAELEKSIEGL